MSIDVAAIMEGSGGLAIPVFVPHGAETVDVFERIARAVEALGAKTEKAGEKAEKSHDALTDKIKKVAEWYSYVSSSVTDFSRRVTEAAEHIAEAASEADRLGRSQRRLHVDFTEAAEGAGGFVSQLEVMNATQALAARDLQLTQREVNALARVAQDYARGTGREFREVSEQLSEAIAKGGEELGRFGGSLGRLATGSHTTEERLRALVAQAEGITPAARTASERIEAFRASLHDADRTFSQAFVTGLAHFEDVVASTRRASDATTSWRDRMQELGDKAAFVAAWIASSFNLAFEAIRFGVRTLGGELAMLGAMATHPFQAGEIRAAHESEAGARRADLDAAYRAHAAITLDRFGNRPATTDAGAQSADMVFTAEDVAAAERDQRARRQRTGSSSSATHDDKSAKAAQMAADQAERELEERQRRAGAEYLQRLVAAETERARLTRESAAAYAEQVTHGDELARIAARIAGLSNEDTAANEVRVTRARAGQTRAEARIGQRAELEDLRDPAVERERVEDAARARELARERRAQEQRLDATQSFTERWRDLHSQQADASRMAAETISGALESMGSSLARHFQLMVQGKETVGEALKAMTSDTLLALAQQAAVKGAMEIAEGIAMLAGIYTAGLAPGHFAAGAAYLGVAALAGLGGGAMASSAGGAGASSAAAPSSRADRALPTSRPANDNAAGTTVIYQYYAPVIGGRSATNAEVGSHMGRYSDAVARRQVRMRPAA